MIVRPGGVTERFTITIAAMVLVGDDDHTSPDDDEKTLSTKLQGSPQLAQRMVSIIIDSTPEDLRVFSENLDARTSIDTLAALTAHVAHQIDAELHRRS